MPFEPFGYRFYGCFQVEQPSQVISNVNQAQVGRSRSYAFLGHDVVKAPLPFYRSKGMLYQGLWKGEVRTTTNTRNKNIVFHASLRSDIFSDIMV